MPTARVAEMSSLPPDVILEAASDFSPRRAELWPDVYVAHLTVHDTGYTWADVTEGNPWPIGLVWERLRYDWSQPGAVKGTVIDSNLFGSTWELHARPDDKGTLVEIVGVRHLRGRGLLLWLLPDRSRREHRSCASSSLLERFGRAALRRCRRPLTVGLARRA